MCAQTQFPGPDHVCARGRRGLPCHEGHRRAGASGHFPRQPRGSLPHTCCSAWTRPLSHWRWGLHRRPLHLRGALTAPTGDGLRDTGPVLTWGLPGPDLLGSQSLPVVTRRPPQRGKVKAQGERRLDAERKTTRGHSGLAGDGRVTEASQTPSHQQWLLQTGRTPGPPSRTCEPTEPGQEWTHRYLKSRQRSAGV